MKNPLFQNFVCRLLLTMLVAVQAQCGVRAAYSDENWDATFGVLGVNGSGVSSFAFGSRHLFVAGSFSSIAGVDATNIAKFDGTNWSDVGGGVGGLAFSHVRALVMRENNLYIAGFFSMAGSVPVNHIARWDGTNWHALGSGVNSVVSALAMSGTNLYAGGQFTHAGGVGANKVARWDGSRWWPLGAGVSLIDEFGQERGAVDALAANGAEVYVGGRFRLAGGLAATNIASYGSVGWAALAQGLRNFNGLGSENGAVRALAIKGSHVLVGGEFRLAGSVSAANVAEWDGSAWLGLGVGVDSAGAVHCLAVNGSDLFVGGFFNSAEGVTAKNIANWDGVAWASLGSGTSAGGDAGSVRALAANGSELFVGGFFTSVGGKPANYIALWHIPHSLNIQRTGNEVTLAWPATGTNFVLEACGAVGSSNWSSLAQTPAIVDNQCVVTNALSPTNQFYRLRRR